ncbi:MAG: hypothetical protein H7039_18420 [Bryobacteraceae bacterium]|nr:hypothetical protein [Bryobacteraceae bacterium]
MPVRFPTDLDRWRNDYVLWVEIFAIFNLACLALDIYLAHSANEFLHSAEYIPFYFSLAAPFLLIAGLLARDRWSKPAIWRIAGFIVGATAIAVGVAGVIYHLDSQFFHERTLRSLTYAAPFAAPLAYTGIGLLLIMNRTVDASTIEWAQWSLVLTLGGFFGNFLLSLADHATNGFFSPLEWIPVASAAFAVAFLVVPFLMNVDLRYLILCAGVLAVQAAIGLIGFLLHVAADFYGPSHNLWDNVVSGAPLFAPLLFPNLALLGWIALWALRSHVPASGPVARLETGSSPGHT